MQFIKSANHAWQGFKSCFYSERNFRLQLIIAVITFLAGLIFKIKRYEWLAILLCTALVLGFEMVNTAIEKLSNIVTTSIHPIIKIVKDMAAGAVFLVSILSLITGCIIFIPQIENLGKIFF